jgi:hypothetical protein
MSREVLRSKDATWPPYMSIISHASDFGGLYFSRFISRSALAFIHGVNSHIVSWSTRPALPVASLSIIRKKPH